MDVKDDDLARVRADLAALQAAVPVMVADAVKAAMREVPELVRRQMADRRNFDFVRGDSCPFETGGAQATRFQTYRVAK
jgi:hypothetical protein